jgi:hypothetical protein
MRNVGAYLPAKRLFGRIRSNIVIPVLGFILFSLLLSQEGFSATRYAVASGPWSSTATWSASSGGAPGASVPDNGDDVTIEGGFNVTVDINNAAANTLQIGGLVNGNGTLTFNAGSQLAVDDGVTLGNGVRTGSLNFTNGGILQIGINGTGTLTVVTMGTFTPGTGTIFYGDNAAQTVATTASLGAPYFNLTLANSGIKTTTGVTVNGVFSLEGTATASVAPTYGPNATLQYKTTTARVASVEVDYSVYRIGRSNYCEYRSYYPGCSQSIEYWCTPQNQ